MTDQQNQAGVELPSWTCHKQVRAAKIESMAEQYNGMRLYLDNGGYVEVDGDYLERHRPEVGGYFVRYQDGYESFSPAEAFEDGYTKDEAVKPAGQFSV